MRLGASAVRTLLRLIDVWLTLGILGMLCIMGTLQNQCLGDLAAGIVVIREPVGRRPPGLSRSLPQGTSRSPTPAPSTGSM